MPEIVTGRLLLRPVSRDVALTLLEGRVPVEKAGMRRRGERLAEEDGEQIRLVVYEASE